MYKKYKGIDQRNIICCDPSNTTKEAGISFENDERQNMLRFHFLELIEYGKKGKITPPILHERTVTMWLDKNNIAELINELHEIYDTL